MNDTYAVTISPPRDIADFTYQGRPCAKGHPGLRYRSNRNCVACQAERAPMPSGWERDSAAVANTVLLVYAEREFDRRGSRRVGAARGAE